MERLPLRTNKGAAERTLSYNGRCFLKRRRVLAQIITKLRQQEQERLI